MRRREFIALLGGALSAWPLAARAQQPEQMRRIGVIMDWATDDPAGQASMAAFQQGLQQMGWGDGGGRPRRVQATNIRHCERDSMLVPIKLTGAKEITSETLLSDSTFKSLGLKETHIEDFLRKNIGLIFEDDDETLLIVGQQVVNNSGGRNDLVALDGDGNLVLIEIKRDSEDMAVRSEPMELQAIRYAASLATIEKYEDLVDKVFAPYINKRKNEFELKELTPEEFGRRKVKEFLKKNEAENTFNGDQRIMLVASDFDEQTLSATAWMSKNGIYISCIRIQPKAHSNNQKESTTNSNEDTTPSLFLEITRLIPPRKVEDFFVSFPDPDTIGPVLRTGPKKRSLPRMAELMDWGILKAGDTLKIKDRDGSEADVIDEKYVKFKGEKLSYNDWGKKVTGWSTIGIYDWAMKGADTLAKLREDKMREQRVATQVEGSTA
jgi:hypothetical protein